MSDNPSGIFDPEADLVTLNPADPTETSAKDDTEIYDPEANLVSLDPEDTPEPPAVEPTEEEDDGPARTPHDLEFGAPGIDNQGVYQTFNEGYFR